MGCQGAPAQRSFLAGLGDCPASVYRKAVSVFKTLKISACAILSSVFLVTLSAAPTQAYAVDGGGGNQREGCAYIRAGAPCR